MANDQRKTQRRPNSKASVGAKKKKQQIMIVVLLAIFLGVLLLNRKPVTDDTTANQEFAVAPVSFNASPTALNPDAAPTVFSATGDMPPPATPINIATPTNSVGQPKANESDGLTDNQLELLLGECELPRLSIDQITEADMFAGKVTHQSIVKTKPLVTAVYQSRKASAAIVGKRIVEPGETLPSGQKVLSVKRSGITTITD